MIKKGLTLIVCFFMFFSLFSQENKTCGQIEYKFTTNFSYKYVENYLLTFNNNNSLCEEINIKKESGKNKKEHKKEGLQQDYIAGRNNVTSKYFYNNRNEFYVRDNFLDEILIVKEVPLIEKWKLHSETKKMSHFLCKKATIYFRGRNYVAWYTSETPVPFGPWKLRGLPGIILELYDVDEVFHITATKVSLGNNICAIKIDRKELERAMTINSYIDRKEELIDLEFAKLYAKSPKGAKPLIRDKNCNDCKQEIEKFNKN